MRERPIVDTWGTTIEERAAAYPCDGLIADPDHVLYRAVDIAAPAEVVFRWICQLRAAPYSYDWLDNLGRLSRRELTPGLQDLAVGQRVMSIFHLVKFEHNRSITIDSTTAVFGRVVVSYVVAPMDSDSSRLVVKLGFNAPSGPHGWIVGKVLPFGDLVMMRRQLLTLKELAEKESRGARSNGR